MPVLSCDIELDEFLATASRTRVMSERFLISPNLKQDIYDHETQKQLQDIRGYAATDRHIEESRSK